MRISRKSVIIFFLLFTSSIGFSQTTFTVEKDFKTIKFDEYIQVHKTLENQTANQIHNNINLLWQKSKGSYGFSKEFYWLKFSVKNTSNSKQELFLEINNPHIKYLEFYEPKGNEFKLKYHCGDYMSFNTRPIDNEKFIFPINLKSNEEKQFYLKVDKRNTSVSFPAYLWTQTEFKKNSNKNKLIRGVFYGGFVFCFLFSIVGFFFLRKQIYLWYSLYILASSLYLFTTMGYSFQYLYPNTVVFTSFFRIVTLIFSAIFLLKFTQSLLKTKTYAFAIHTLINIVVYGFLVSLLIQFLLPSFYKNNITFMVKAVYILLLIATISYFLAAFFTYSKQKEVARLYLASFGVLFICGAISLLLEYGWALEYRPYVSLLFIGTLLEVVVLGLSILNNVRLTYKEKNNLTIKVAEKQQEISQAFIDGMEKEKVIISNELHDDIGSRMANFLRQVDHEKEISSTSRNKLTTIIDDIRKISHQLAPKDKNLLSFKERLTNLIEESFFNTNINFDFQFLGTHNFLNEKEELNVYRILQEILHNILKHSKANSVEIQFVNFDDEITLTIEDNGIGFDIDKKNTGIGIENIQTRIDYLNGNIEISSIKNKGTFIVIVIPSTEKQ